MVNPSTGKLSAAYDTFPDPLVKGPTGAFDIHIYYFQERQVQKDFARTLWERIRRECKFCWKKAKMKLYHIANVLCVSAWLYHKSEGFQSTDYTYIKFPN